MNQELQAALKNPSVVLAAGPRPPASRNSVKKASGLIRLGAAVMLGVALLSPLNAMAQGQQHIEQSYRQTTEMVDQAKQEAEEDVDWFNTQVEGRNWHNHGAPTGQPIHVPSWVRDGVLRASEQGPEIEMASREGAVQPAPRSKLGQELDAIWAAADARHAHRQAERAEAEAARTQAEIDARADAPSFEMGRNEYNFYKDYDLVGADFQDASPAQQNDFVARLVKDTYIEMQAGHSAESPSQRMVDACQQIKDVAGSSALASPGSQGREVFQACASEQMQSNILVNKIQKGAAYAGLAVAAIIAKGISIGAFMATAGTLLGGGFNDRLTVQRERKKDPRQDFPPRIPTVR